MATREQNPQTKQQREDCAHTHTMTRTAQQGQRESDWRIVRKEGGRSSSVEMAGQASVGSIRGSIAEISVATYFGGQRECGRREKEKGPDL